MSNKVVTGCKHVHGELVLFAACSWLAASELEDILLSRPVNVLPSRTDAKSEQFFCFALQNWLKDDNPAGALDEYEEWAATNQESFESYYGQVLPCGPVRDWTMVMHMCLSWDCLSNTCRLRSTRF